MVRKNNTAPTLADWLQSSLVKTCRVHFSLIAILAVYTIASDATHLITPKVVLQRWEAIGILLIVTAIVWYAARNKTIKANYYRLLIYVLIATDLLFATFSIYTQRGMASRAIILFAIPIIVSSILLSRVAIFMTAAIATTGYSLAAIKYFVDFFNEGYKAELYIEVSFYCAIFFIIAALLSNLVKFSGADHESKL